MIKEAHNIFIVGIGGSAMCNLALILKKMDKNVSGSDVPTISTTDKILEQYNIPFVTNFDAHNLPQETDLVIYSGSFSGARNEQVIEAQKRNIAILSLAQVNGELTKMFEMPIAVCGTHGKTTTSSLLAYALKKLDAHPSYLIGTSTFNEYYGGDYDQSKYFVIEADEYAVNPPQDKTPKFHMLSPQYIICNNIDFDHPDVYRDLEHTKSEFQKFFTNTLENSDAKLFACADNEALMQVVSELPKDKTILYGYDVKADFQIINFKSYEHITKFELMHKGILLGEFEVSLFGNKNISNVAAVISVLITLGFKVEDIKEAIRLFTGAKRRFEQVAYNNDIYLFDDYAHNPQKVETAIQAAKDRFNTRRVIVLFQPHTYSRTLALKNEFAKALAIADYSLITPIFASAREKQEDYPVTSQDLERAAKEEGFEHIAAYSDNQSVLQHLSQIMQRGDVIMMIGAGDIHKMKSDIIRLMQSVK